MEDVSSQLLDLKNGPTGLLISLCVIFSLQLVFRVVEFLWRLKEKKDSASDSSIKELTAVMRQNTTATEHLERRLIQLENALLDLPKFKSRVQKLYSAIRHIAGEEWHRIKAAIDEEEEL